MSTAIRTGPSSGIECTPRRNARDPASKPSEPAPSPPVAEELDSLVAACREGDQTAFRRLYDLCQPRVYRLAARMVGRQQAADVSQQTFLQAFRELRQFKGRSAFNTWLYRLAVNESLQYLRRSRRWNYVSLDWEPSDEANWSESMVQRELLEMALARIDPKLRALFLLREVDGLSYAEIAAATGTPAGTVGSRLNRARRALRTQLSDPDRAFTRQGANR